MSDRFDQANLQVEGLTEYIGCETVSSADLDIGAVQPLGTLEGGVGRWRSQERLGEAMLVFGGQADKAVLLDGALGGEVRG